MWSFRIGCEEFPDQGFLDNDSLRCAEFPFLDRGFCGRLSREQRTENGHLMGHPGRENGELTSTGGSPRKKERRTDICWRVPTQVSVLGYLFLGDPLTDLRSLFSVPGTDLRSPFSVPGGPSDRSPFSALRSLGKLCMRSYQSLKALTLPLV